MIITRTPFRIPLGGGGTDLPSYYSKYGGALISAAIKKYVYITVNKRFDDSIRVSYSETEIANHADEIRHPLVREALRLTGVDRGVEVVSIADLPGNTGMGSSGSFCVGLLNALHAYKRARVSAEQLAEEAFHIEHDILGEPVGKQDQYLAAFGRITALDIDCSGRTNVESYWLADGAVDQLESNLLLFYTGIRRKASEMLAGQDSASEQNDKQVIESLHSIKEIGFEIREALKQGNVRRFGELLDVHWQTKKRLSDRITRPDVDRWYEIAMMNGALGGKLMGAGGGGFFMFYCDNGKDALRNALTAEGLREMRFRIDGEGSKVLINI